MADSTTEPKLGESAGALLRAARERQGLHIAALAAAIKVAPRKLDALENDRWHELPDATFVRALAQTVCRTLKIDARPILQRLPAAGTVALEPGDGQHREPFRDRPGRGDSGLAVAAVKPMVWAAVVLMLAAVAVYFAPSGLWGAANGVAQVPAPASPASEPAVLASAAPVATAAPAADVVLPAASGVSAASAPAPAAAGETVFLAPPPAAVPPTAAAPVPTDARPAAGIVQLRSGEASWVEARDGRGQLLLSRTVQPGESVGLDGALPIRLTIGNAASTQLSFRGQAVDLATRTRDNVARVELQ